VVAGTALHRRTLDQESGDRVRAGAGPEVRATLFDGVRATRPGLCSGCGTTRALGTLWLQLLQNALIGRMAAFPQMLDQRAIQATPGVPLVYLAEELREKHLLLIRGVDTSTDWQFRWAPHGNVHVDVVPFKLSAPRFGEDGTSVPHVADQVLEICRRVDGQQVCLADLLDLRYDAQGDDFVQERGASIALHDLCLINEPCLDESRLILWQPEHESSATYVPTVVQGYYYSYAAKTRFMYHVRKGQHFILPMVSSSQEEVASKRRMAESLTANSTRQIKQNISHAQALTGSYEIKGGCSGVIREVSGDFWAIHGRKIGREMTEEDTRRDPCLAGKVGWRIVEYTNKEIELAAMFKVVGVRVCSHRQVFCTGAGSAAAWCA